MEAIFTTPGFKHIANKLIHNLDAKSMVNLSQVNQIMAKYFNCLKICQQFFGKWVSINPKEMELNMSYAGSYLDYDFNLKNPRPLEICHMSFRNRNFRESHFLKKLPNLKDSVLNHLSHEDRGKTLKLWKIYQFGFQDLDLFPLVVSQEKALKEFHQVILQLFKVDEKCPLILAMILKEEYLTEFLIKSGMPSICTCLNLNLLLETAIRLQWSNVVKCLLLSKIPMAGRKDFHKFLHFANRKRKLRHEEDNFWDIGKKVVNVEKPAKRRRISSISSNSSYYSNYSSYSCSLSECSSMDASSEGI